MSLQSQLRIFDTGARTAITTLSAKIIFRLYDKIATPHARVKLNAYRCELRRSRCYGIFKFLFDRIINRFSARSVIVRVAERMKRGCLCLDDASAVDSSLPFDERAFLSSLASSCCYPDAIGTNSQLSEKYIDKGCERQP